MPLKIIARMILSWLVQALRSYEKQVGCAALLRGPGLRFGPAHNLKDKISDTNGFRGRDFSCQRLAPSGPDVYRNRDSIMLSSSVGAAPNITPTGLGVVRTIFDYKHARPYGADTTNSAGIRKISRATMTMPREDRQKLRVFS